MGIRVTASGVTLDGLDLSGVDDDGVDWKLETIKGWTGSPASTGKLRQRSGANGAWPSSRPRKAARVLTLTGSFSHRDPALVSAAADQLNAAVGLDLVKIEVAEGGRTRWAMVRQSPDEVIVDDTIATSYGYSVQLDQPDPLKYGDTVNIVTGLPAAEGGLAVPFGVPFGITSTVTSGQVSATNPGNATGPVWLRIDGPVTGPIITHVGTGRSLVFSADLTIADGDWLDVDMQLHTALANGTAPRAGQIQQRGWSGFEPGGNTWSFTAAQPSPTARLTVTAIQAWR